MMNKRTFGLAIAAASLLSPALSQAGQRTSLNACVNAFERSLDAPAGASHNFKVVLAGDRFGDALSELFFPSTYTFDLAANDPKTGKVYARARCLTDDRGTVESLAPLPLLADSPRLARADD
jgi:hypothetical protein